MHIDFPDNSFQLPAEGGTATFSYRDWNLFTEEIKIDGIKGECEPIYNEGTYIGAEVNGWLRLFEGKYVGRQPEEKVIEVLPNTTGVARSAEIIVFNPGPTYYYGEIFVHQTAQ